MAASNLPEKVPTPDTTPSGSDLLYKVNDPYGTPVDDATTIANAVTKGHGLADGYIETVSGVLTKKTAAEIKTGLSLNNVDNTSDANKPVSTAQQTALDAKQASGATLTSLEGLSLAQGDILYATAADTLARLPKGTANQQLRVNAGETAPEWATISAGGQTLVTHIVAASGGTHTTLGAAIAAASNGDTIWVREGTYSESAITSSLTNLTIIGENRESSILSITSNTITFSGTKVNIRNLNVTATTGGIAHSGTYGSWQDCNLNISGDGHLLNITGQGTTAINCNINDTNASTHSTATITMGGAQGNFIDNNCILGVRRGSLTAGSIHISGDEVKTNGNTIDVVNVAASSVVVSTAGNYGSISFNQFNPADSNTVARMIFNNGAKTALTGNIIEDGIVGIYSLGEASITGGAIRVTGTGAIGVYFDVAGMAVTGVQITATGGTGIDTGTNNHCTVNGNTILTGSIGINIQAGGAWGNISGNSIASAVTTAIVDASVSNTVMNNSGADVTQNKLILKMKNTSGGDLAAGDVVVLKAVAAGNEVTTTTTASDNQVFGMATTAISNNAFGPIQVSGKTAALKVDGTTDIAIGDFLTTFTTAKIARKAAAGTLGTTPGDLAFAIALEAYTTNDSAGIIDALLISPRRL